MKLVALQATIDGIRVAVDNNNRTVKSVKVKSRRVDVKEGIYTL